MIRNGEPRQARAAEPSRGTSGRSLFDRIAAADARRYVRLRDLPSLVALWPHELQDLSPKGALLILAKLRRALRAERRRARAGHWSYDLNRHLALLGAYKGELALLRGAAPLSRNERGAASLACEAGAAGTENRANCVPSRKGKAR